MGGVRHMHDMQERLGDKRAKTHRVRERAMGRIRTSRTRQRQGERERKLKQRQQKQQQQQVGCSRAERPPPLLYALLLPRRLTG